MRPPELLRGISARALTVVGLALSACGGSSFDGHVYQSADLAFRVHAVPPEWRRIETDGALLTFRDDQLSASIVVNGRCRKDGDDVPLSSLTHHLFLQFTDRAVEEQSAFELDGREALRTKLLARLDGVQKRFTVVVLKKNGCVYDFVQVAPPEASSEGQQRFAAFVEGFSTIKP